MTAAEFLLEIGTEEIPAKFLPGLTADLEREARAALEQARLAYVDIHVWSTPRRLALLVEGLASRQRDQETEVKGPSEKAAFGEGGQAAGQLTKAAEGFARSQGVDPAELYVQETPAGRYVFARRRSVGRDTAEVLPEIAAGLVASLQVERPMRWGDYDFRFIRPIRWLVALYGDDVIPFEVAGVRSGRTTHGHRFLAAGETPTIFRAAVYREVMERFWVMVDPAERRRVIAEGAAREAARHGGWPMLDDELLDEIVNLVEYPTILAGGFSREFLEVPAPILITTMRHHQRYIPVAEAQDGKLLPVFIVVRNGGEEGLDLVRAGNEKVLHARLADARFFYEEDRKQSLVDRVEALDGILFLEGFGTMRDKTERLVSLAGALWDRLGLPADGAPQVGRAARLAKADLASKVVCEFTELQGVMGREYALLSGEDHAVAQAIGEHYLPQSAGDQPPVTPYGRVLSMADKLDTVVGCFAAGIEPTGSHDPYGLRRQAAGALATAVAGGYSFSLAKIIPEVAEPFQRFVLAAGEENRGRGKSSAGWDPDRLTAAILTFFLPRLRVILEEEGISYDVADAATADWGRSGDAVRTLARARALGAFKGAGQFENLSASYIRVTGLAGKAAPGERAPTPNLFTEDAESQLYQACLAAQERIAAIVETSESRARSIAASGRGPEAVDTLTEGYHQILDELSNLRPAVDAFFDQVLVMTDEEAVRENRLALIKAVAGLMGAAGDLSRLVVA